MLESCWSRHLAGFGYHVCVPGWQPGMHVSHSVSEGKLHTAPLCLLGPAWQINAAATSKAVAAALLDILHFHIFLPEICHQQIRQIAYLVSGNLSWALGSPGAVAALVAARSLVVTTFLFGFSDNDFRFRISSIYICLCENVCPTTEEVRTIRWPNPEY
jgi:hypothetical protein